MNVKLYVTIHNAKLLFPIMIYSCVLVPSYSCYILTAIARASINVLNATLPSTQPVIEMAKLETPADIAIRLAAEEKSISSPEESAFSSALDKAAQRAKRHEEAQRVYI